MAVTEKMFLQPLVHNLALQQALEEEGLFVGTLWEQRWLQQQLARSEARAMLGEDYERLTAALEAAPHTLPPPGELAWFRLLRRAQAEGLGVRLAWEDNRGVHKEGPGWPLALEFYCSRQAWYLHWWSGGAFDSYSLIPLRQVQGAALGGAPRPARVQEEFRRQRRQFCRAVVRLPPAYAAEHWRLLCALTRFDKEVAAEEDGALTVQLSYVEDDYGYLRMRLRSLGLRVEVLEPERLRRDLLADAREALARYGRSVAGSEEKRREEAGG